MPGHHPNLVASRPPSTRVAAVSSSHSSMRDRERDRHLQPKKVRGHPHPPGHPPTHVDLDRHKCPPLPHFSTDPAQAHHPRLPQQFEDQLVPCGRPVQALGPRAVNRRVRDPRRRPRRPDFVFCRRGWGWGERAAAATTTSPVPCTCLGVTCLGVRVWGVLTTLSRSRTHFPPLFPPPPTPPPPPNRTKQPAQDRRRSTRCTGDKKPEEWVKIPVEARVSVHGGALRTLEGIVFLSSETFRKCFVCLGLGWCGLCGFHLLCIPSSFLFLLSRWVGGWVGG